MPTRHSIRRQASEDCKMRGIMLNYSTSHLDNFEVIKDVVLDGNEKRHVTVHTENKIKRKRRAV